MLFQRALQAVTLDRWMYFLSGSSLAFLLISLSELKIALLMILAFGVLAGAFLKEQYREDHGHGAFGTGLAEQQRDIEPELSANGRSPISSPIRIKAPAGNSQHGELTEPKINDDKQGLTPEHATTHGSGALIFSNDSEQAIDTSKSSIADTTKDNNTHPKPAPDQQTTDKHSKPPNPAIAGPANTRPAAPGPSSKPRDGKAKGGKYAS
ncbi:MAG: hypothetical protein Q9182_001295 [Xanthomendoza sp. 2 TL-2023]